MGEMEALSSLAGYAFEHPDDPFPEFAESGPWLEAEGIAHPLIPEGRAVRNDVATRRRIARAGGQRLEHVGQEHAAADAGNQHRAGAGGRAGAGAAHEAFAAGGGRVDPPERFAARRRSRFYAEILRLRQILDLTAGPLPVLFLIDEFLHGTNSHDRRIGAEAMVRGLVERGAIGLITTHDLALAESPMGWASALPTYISRTRVENGQIHFDYVMRPGVVRKSNAIELMRSGGAGGLTVRTPFANWRAPAASNWRA